MSPRIITLRLCADLAEASGCLVDGGADDVAGDYEFNSAILLATC